MDPQKVQHKYDGDGDGVDTSPKLTSLWYSYGDKTLDGSTCKMYN